MYLGFASNSWQRAPKTFKISSYLLLLKSSIQPQLSEVTSIIYANEDPPHSLQRQAERSLVPRNTKTDGRAGAFSLITLHRTSREGGKARG